MERTEVRTLYGTYRAESEGDVGSRKMKIREANPDDVAWPQVAALFPKAVGWLNGATDKGDYRFLVAIDESDNLLGASVVDIGNLVFGPLSKVSAGFLENIEVVEAHRKKRIGAALLRATLNLAWQCGCESVRSTVDYDNSAALALYRSQGLGFIPEEDPDAPEPEKCYAIVAINPKRVENGYGCQQDAAHIFQKPRAVSENGER